MPRRETAICWAAAALLLTGCERRKDASPPDPLGTVSEWGALSNGLQCGISLPKSSFSVGEEIAVKVRLRNATDRPIDVPRTYYVGDPEHGPAFRSGIDPVVTNEVGARLKPISLARIKITQPWQSLPPGAEVGFDFILLDWFSLAPGRYTLRLDFTRKYSGFAEGSSSSVSFSIVGAVAEGEVAWGEAVSGLQAGMAVTGVDATKIAFRFTVRNVGTKPIRILKLSEQAWCPLPVAIRVVGQSPRYIGVQAAPPPLKAKDFIYLPPGTGSSVERYTLLADWGIKVPCKMSVTFVFSWQAKEVTTHASPFPKVGGLWTGVARSGTVEIEIAAKGGAP